MMARNPNELSHAPKQQGPSETEDTWTLLDNSHWSGFSPRLHLTRLGSCITVLIGTNTACCRVFAHGQK